MIVESQELYNKIAYAASLSKRIAELTKEYKEIKKDLVKELGDGPTIAYNGYPLVNIINREGLRFDTKRFKAEHMDLYNEYLKKTSSKCIKFNPDISN